MRIVQATPAGSPVPRILRRCLQAYGLTLTVLMSAAVGSPMALASEGGTFGNYGVGSQTLGSAILAPQDTTAFYGYLLYYTADSFRDGDGNSAISDFNLALRVEATYLRHTWKWQPAGLSFASGLIQEAVRVDVEVGGVRDRSTGLFLMNVVPVILGGSAGNVHYLFASHFLIPAGDYEPDALANHTLNYGTYSQEVSLTWLPTSRWILDLSTNLSFNWENPDTNYRSGNLLGLTYGVNYRPDKAPKWQIGVGGLYLNQFTDDEVDGKSVPGGFRLRKLNAGPQATYWVVPGSTAVMFKWTHEWEVRNGPKGDLFWIQGAIPF